MDITELIKICHTQAKEKGFWDEQRNVAELLMLIVTEISEACEALRKGDPSDNHIPQFSNFSVELADAVIRIFDLCGSMNIDLEEVITAKLAFNMTRKKKHGKRF